MTGSECSPLAEAFRADALRTAARIDEWAHGEPTFRLGFITDIHSGGNEKYRHRSLFAAQKEVLHMDLLADGGDLGLDLGEDAATTETLLARTEEGLRSASPFLYCKGNHDYGTQCVPNTTIVDRLLSPFAASAGAEVVHDGEGGGYGSYTDPGANVLVLFLNTSEGNTRAFRMFPAQLSWLVRRLEQVREGQSVVILSHFCLDREIGKWKSYPDDGENEAFRTIRQILPDFVARRRGKNEETGIGWDFTAVPESAHLVCALAGDSHFNNHIRRDGVTYIVRQGYGGVNPDELPAGATKDLFDFHAHPLFDVLAVRRDGSAGLFRVGAGDTVRDLPDIR